MFPQPLLFGAVMWLLGVVFSGRLTTNFIEISTTAVRLLASFRFYTDWKMSMGFSILQLVLVKRNNQIKSQTIDEFCFISFFLARNLKLL